MALSGMDILNKMSQEFILGNTTSDEQLSFIEEQIHDPFDSGSNNYFKKLKKMVTDPHELDEICDKLFTEIEDVYPDIDFDLSEYDHHLDDIFSACYKFFIKNINKLMYAFIRGTLYSNKARKNLLADYANTKIGNYPKEQYGKREYYIIITYMNAIVKSIFEDDIRLSRFIETIEKTDECPVYIDVVKDAMEAGIIIDHGVVKNFFTLFKASDQYRSTLNKLEIDFTKTFIIPCLEENGLMDVRLPAVEDPEDDLTDDDDDKLEEDE